MDFIEILKAIIIGIVEGITEWLPISSTGHMILVDEFVRMRISDAFKEMFLVVIQLGAILAVVCLYFNKLNPFSLKKTALQRCQTWQMWLKVVIACLPAAVIGLLFDDMLNDLFYNSWVVSITLIVYGVAFIIVENLKRKAVTSHINELSYKTAFYIGIFQLLSLIPGTSRSGSTILGAVILGVAHSVAAEFSFFLSIPVMVGASGLKIVKYFLDGNTFSSQETVLLIVGMFVAFIVSVLVIKMLMSYIKRHDFKVFGWYRIVLGIIVLAYFGIVASL
ncbi:MAG: undecaprenyl-diphosphate phosphatase [bacterium]|nr:undecaprenyl-diphosphate phosphatase [bacterium]